MKILSVLLFSIIFVHLLASELAWVDEQIQAIKPPRAAMSKTKIDLIQNPFIFSKKENPKSSKKNTTQRSSKRYTAKNTSNEISTKDSYYTLQAIINKSALINGRWYKLHAKVGKYTLSHIENKAVILSYKNKKLVLSTRTKVKKLKFKNN